MGVTQIGHPSFNPANPNPGGLKSHYRLVKQKSKFPFDLFGRMEEQDKSINKRFLGYQL